MAQTQLDSEQPPGPRPAGGPLVGADLERCIYCQGTAIIRQGRRYKKHETVQLWYCYTCRHVFTPKTTKGKTYPLKVIVESLVLYHRGYTRAEVAAQVKERFGLTLPERTLSSWLAEHRELTSYRRLRDSLAAEFSPCRVIRTVRLHHQQVYHYGIHRGKLSAILSGDQHRRFQPVGAFLEEMVQACPHHLFQGNARASQGKTAYDLSGVEIRAKRNHACRVAGLVLQSVIHHKRRHDELQRFMLATDSVTVAVEVPIVLSPDDIANVIRLGFDVPIETTTQLTGHIDFLQIRNGAVHILDYKPGAKSEKPIAQLMVYALALSQRTGLKLFDFVCAWFDEHDYFEFYPLHVVHKRERAQARVG